MIDAKGYLEQINHSPKALAFKMRFKSELAAHYDWYGQFRLGYRPTNLSDAEYKALSIEYYFVIGWMTGWVPPFRIARRRLTFFEMNVIEGQVSLMTGSHVRAALGRSYLAIPFEEPRILECKIGHFTYKANITTR